MKRSSAIVCLGIALLAIFGCSRPRYLREVLPAKAPVQKDSPTEIGNGGDFVRLLFEQGRLHAIEVLQGIELASVPEAVSKVVPYDEIRWLFDNREMLANDLRRSRHVWFDRAEELSCRHRTCACTGITPGAPVRFSFESCAAKFQHNNRAEAGQVLIHESIHHFFGEDEDRADRMAAAVYAIWRNMGSSGRMRWVYWEPSPFGFVAPNQSAWSGREWVVWGDRQVGYYNPLTRRWRVQVIPPVCHDPFMGLAALVGAWGTSARVASAFVDGKLIRYMRGDETKGSPILEGRVFDTNTRECYSLTAPPFKPLPGLRARAVAAGGKLLVYDATTGVGSVYDAKTRAWRPMSSKGAAIFHVHSELHWTGNRLLVLGGTHLDLRPLLSPQTFILALPVAGALYDPETDSWEELPKEGAPQSRSNATVVSSKDKIFLFGGSVGSDIRWNGGVYDLATKKWEAIDMSSNQAPTPESSGADPHARLAGGWIGSRVMLVGSGIWYYDVAAKRWTTTDPILHPHWEPKLVASAWTGLEYVLWNGVGGYSLQAAD